MQCMRQEPNMDVIGTHYSFATNDTEYFNVFNPAEMTFDLDSFDPDVILHTGALTHVDYCESHPDESFHHTVESTIASIELAKKFSAKFVFISSDYIFDGQNGPYDEKADANPLSIYGKHKLQAEQFVKEMIDDYLILRITNVYGYELRGKNFVAFLVKTAQSKQKKTLRLPKDQFATPINAYDIGKFVCSLLKDNKCGVYNLASDEYLSRVELAEKVLKHFPGHKIKVEPLSTQELGQAAPRPLKGGLKNDKIKSEYPDLRFSTVDEFMKENYAI